MSNLSSNRTLKMKKIAPDRFPFDPEQLRNEWDAHKSCRRPKRRSIERRSALSTIVHPSFAISSTCPDLCREAVEVNCSNRNLSSFMPHVDDEKLYRSYDRFSKTTSQIINSEEEKDDNSDVDSPTKMMPSYCQGAQQQSLNVYVRGISHEIQNPFLRRISQTGCGLPKYVHQYVLRMKSSVSEKEFDQSNIMFEEMKQISDSNLLNYIKGKDSYYNS